MTELPELTKFLLGIETICRYEENASISAIHGFIYVGNYDFTYQKMSESDRTAMKLWGWLESEESWGFYVSDG